MDIEPAKLDIEHEKLDIESKKLDIEHEQLDIEPQKLDIDIAEAAHRTKTKDWPAEACQSFLLELSQCIGHCDNRNYKGIDKASEVRVVGYPVDFAGNDRCYNQDHDDWEQPDSNDA